MERAVYGRMAELEERHWWFHGRRQVVAELIGRYLPARPGPTRSGPRLLEVGCGTGGNLALLRRFGRVEAVEYDAEARALAETKSGLRVGFCALPDKLDVEDGSFDLIVLLDVLEHVGDDIGALRRIKAKLAPGGRVLVTVPALPWLWSEHDQTHHHFRRYTRTALRRRAEAAGLNVVDAGFFSTLLFPLVAATRFAKKALRLRGADDRMPGPVLNRILSGIFALEGKLVGRIGLPIGSSLFLVAE